MSNWLIIGDSSFTGTALAAALTAQGETVQGGSLRDGSALAALATPWDYVVNFAALNVVAPSWDHPADYCTVNLVNQIPLWEAMRANAPRAYVHVSTPEVYGTTKFKVTEDYRHAPSTPYAVSRSAAEQMLLCYWRRYGLPVVFTRACNVYGPNQQLYRFIPKLIWSILKGVPFPLEGGGQSIRSWMNVRDCASGIALVARSGTIGEAYHISTSDTFRIHDIAQAICNAMNVPFRDAVTLAPARPGQDLSYSLDTSAIEALGWQQTIAIRPGVREVIQWMKDNWSTLKDQSTDYVYTP